MSEIKEVTIYTDGAAVGNPGPGGYSAILIYGNYRKELTGGFRMTTNNRMEIMGAIAALEALKSPCRVTLHSDSEYLVKAITNGWALRWRSRGWWRTLNERAANADLWERLLGLMEQHEVEFVHVRGHAGSPENERCDLLAEASARRPDLPADTAFEDELKAGERGKRRDIREGELCRKCSTPVVKRAPRKAPKPGQAIYYEYYLYCPKCQTIYTVEEGKRDSPPGETLIGGLFNNKEDSER